MPTPGVQFRAWCSSRPAAPVTRADLGDTVPVRALNAPPSAGRPPVPPAFPERIEIEPVVVSVGVGSGWRVTRAAVPGAAGQADAGGRYAGPLWRAVVTLEWGPMTGPEWAALRAFLVDGLGVAAGGGGGALRAMTIDIDGADVPESAVDVRLLGLGEAIEQLVHVDGRGAGTVDEVIRFGPVRAEVVW